MTGLKQQGVYDPHLFLMFLWFQACFLRLMPRFPQGERHDREAGTIQSTSEETATRKLQQPQVCTHSVHSFRHLG